MFGRTKDPHGRVTEHIRAAEVHGWALVDAWVSPGVTSAQRLEQIVLTTVSFFHGGLHHRERFYGLDYQLGLKIARVVFELDQIGIPE